MKVFTISWIIVILFLLIYLAYNKLKKKETHKQSPKKNKAVTKVKTEVKHGEIKEKIDNENPAHLTKMYLLRDKLNESKSETEFNSIKQKLIHLIKIHSPKNRLGNHVSIAFIKDGGDMLDGIILSDIEALEFKKMTSKEPSEHELNELQKLLEKLTSDDLNPWFEIVKARSSAQAPLDGLMGIKMSDYNYWGKAHAEEYLQRMGSNISEDDPRRLEIDDLKERKDAFNKIAITLKAAMDKAKELNIDLNEMLINDYHTAISSSKGAALAMITYKKNNQTDIELHKPSEELSVDPEQPVNSENLLEKVLENMIKTVDESNDGNGADAIEAFKLFMLDEQKNDLAYEEYEKGRYDNGIKLAKEAHLSSPGNSYYCDTIAEGYFFLKQYETAIEYSNKAILLDEKNKSEKDTHFFMRAKIHLAMENINLAKKDFEKVLEIDSNHEEAIKYLNQINK
jgi:tetratricopeptide (TPR) repeat protein